MDKKPRSTDSANVRPARRDDVDAITELYGLYVAQGTMTFETIPPTAAEMAARLARVHEHGLPYVIAECDGRLAGFAYALPYRPRPAYRFTVESSVYVASFAARRGLGRQMMKVVISGAGVAGKRQMIAAIGDSSNRASLALHRALGFSEIGRLADVGFKFGRWLDIVLMQRPLGDGPTRPPDTGR